MEDEKFKRAFAIIETHGKNIFNAVNYEMVTMYYELGEYLFGELENKHWGEGTIRNFSESIKANYPELKGFSPRSIYKMIQFYKTYRHNVIVPTLLAKISWSNNVMILNIVKRLRKENFTLSFASKTTILHVNLIDKYRQNIMSVTYYQMVMSLNQKQKRLMKMIFQTQKY